MLEWNVHDYPTEEELTSIVDDLKRFKDAYQSRSGTGWSTIRSLIPICDPYLSYRERATWCFARCDLADLKEARDNLDKEGFFLDLYHKKIAANSCPHRGAEA